MASLRRTLKRGLTTPDPLHGNMRLCDLFAAFGGLLLGLAVRLAWDTDWSILIAFFGAWLGMFITARFVPSWPVERHTGPKERRGR